MDGLKPEEKIWNCHQDRGRVNGLGKYEMITGKPQDWISDLQPWIQSVGMVESFFQFLSAVHRELNSARVVILLSKHNHMREKKGCQGDPQGSNLIIDYRIWIT